MLMQINDGGTRLTLRRAFRQMSAEGACGPKCRELHVFVPLFKACSTCTITPVVVLRVDRSACMTAFDETHGPATEPEARAVVVQERCGRSSVATAPTW